MAGREIIVQTVTGLGYDVVEIVRTGGTLRVTIDWPWVSPAAGTQGACDDRFVTIEDCETVTRQLQFALEVDNVPYQRLEVSSPGIDRLLRCDQDFERFAGHTVDITLKIPLGDASGRVQANRKKFRGVLQRVESAVSVAPDGGRAPDRTAQHEIDWQIVWHDLPAIKPGQKVSKKRPIAPVLSLGFILSDIKEARLAPIVSFKGRRHTQGEGCSHLDGFVDLTGKPSPASVLQGQMQTESASVPSLSN